MNIEPNDEIGMEVHPDTDQFIRIEQGDGYLILDNKNILLLLVMLLLFQLDIIIMLLIHQCFSI